MDTANAPPASHGVTMLTSYARDMMRLWLEARQGPQPTGGFDFLKGFGVSTQTASERLRDEPWTPAPEALQRREELLSRLDDWISSPPEPLYPLAELTALFKLSTQDLCLLIMAAGPALDPALLDLYRYSWDNIHKQCADVGFICQVAALGDSERFEALTRRLLYSAPLRRHRLVLVEDRRSSENTLDLNLPQRRIRVADQVLNFLRFSSQGVIPVDEALASTCTRLREPVEVQDLRLPEHSKAALLQIARNRKLPAMLQGPPGGGKEKAAMAMATLLGKGLLSADLGALLNEPPETLALRMAELLREARLGGDLVYLQGHDLPAMVTGPTRLVLNGALQEEALLVGVDELPSWAVKLTTGWPVVSVPLPDLSDRVEAWSSAFEGDRRAPEAQALEAISRRYQMSVEQILQAASEARRRAQISKRSRVGLRELDRACRAHFAHQLSDVAQSVPPAHFSTDQLILPDSEKIKFDEILLYAQEHDAIYNDWGFAEKFPYGRGLSVLFYGPPGTGKTMGAMIIAGALGLDLYRVDLSRIMSRYVGETEKNLAKVFDEAERGQVMLLFDEADSLFTKRTEVKSSVDRYANLEVAYLLQRMENFEGVTVLTTNVEKNLDDAFKRRIRYRIYFPMPDAKTRARLWRSLLPSAAPVRQDIPFKLLGRHFELSGGYIKQAILRAGFYARRSGRPIGLRELIEGATAECRELGMLISDTMPKAIKVALDAEDDQDKEADQREDTPSTEG